MSSLCFLTSSFASSGGVADLLILGFPPLELVSLVSEEFELDLDDVLDEELLD
jgi:hypothetical protein